MAINVIYNQFDYEINQRKKEVWDKYNEIIQWGRMHPLRFAEIFLGLEFTDHQKYVFMSTWCAKEIVWVMSRNSGKSQFLDTPVYSAISDRGEKYPKKTIGDLKIGDKIYDENGELTEVIHLNPIIFEDVFEVEFEDGEIIECNGEHLWGVYDAFESNQDFKLIIKETQELYNLMRLKNKEVISNRFFVPLCKTLQTPNSTRKAIINIRKTNQKKPMRCITVSNKSGLYLCGNKATVTHNSYLSAPYIMTRSMLIPDHSTYIMSVTGNQSQETFSKMEDLALGKIASVAGSTRVFVNEVIKQNSAQSGFVHDKNSYSCELFNGATIKTLNSVPKNIVGIRSNLNLYDEAGKIDREFFALTKPFTAQNTDFITGKGINTRCIPRQFPTQNILCSSAEDIFTELWSSYRLGAMEMMMGNKDYFVCDLDCRFSLHPKKNGKPMTPLVSKQVVDNAIAQNEFRANREYFNKFDLAGGQDCLVNKMTLVRNSRGYMPVFEHEEGKRYIIVNDPSSKVDNSIVLVAELFRDEEKGWMVKIVNCRNLIEKGKGGNKIILQKPQQIEIIKQMIVDYNGPHPDYVNLERIIIDAGSGGGGFDIAAWLMPGWVDSENQQHIGVIDLKDKYCKEREDTFKSAKDILTLANFTRDKVKMYENTSDALNQGLVIFPKDSNGRGEMEFENKDSEGNTVIEKVKMSQKQ